MGGNAQIKAMKKVAGSLKLDQAQYRELEAFSKFGSDLDATTKTVLARGERNVEILKQPRYSPMPVDKQIAILYLGTSGLLVKINVKDIKAFENEFLQLLEAKHKNVLEILKKGIIDDSIMAVLRETAKDIEPKYAK